MYLTLIYDYEINYLPELVFLYLLVTRLDDLCDLGGLSFSGLRCAGKFAKTAKNLVKEPKQTKNSNGNAQEDTLLG